MSQVAHTGVAASSYYPATPCLHLERDKAHAHRNRPNPPRAARSRRADLPRLRYTDKFEDPNLPGEIQVTVDLRKVLCGTEIQIVQEGIPEVIPVEMCYLGWQESLAQLATLVEPEIAG